MLKKLVAKMAQVTKGIVMVFPEGYRYIVLVDPETGESYVPKPGWEVTGENLLDLFDPDPDYDYGAIPLLEGEAEWVGECEE